MKKKDIDSKLEFLETSPEAAAAGLRRIKRRHFTGPPELLPGENDLKVEILVDAEVADFFRGDSRRINTVLRSTMEREKIARELLSDSEFINGIREKLAA